jgi:hypothetical protein
MAQKIKIVSNRPWLTKDSVSVPRAIIKTLPEWYRKADKWVKNPQTDEYWEDPTYGKMPTWKGCPAIFDIMGSGYTLVTPCDVEILIGEDGKLTHKITDQQYQDFVSDRLPMPGFENPVAFAEEHFAWYPDWAIEVPEGYSVLYTQPFNRFELPFMTTSGIIDNDKVHLQGTMPFFVPKGWTGVIPAGTPYVQMFPFKRDDWESEVVIENPNNRYKKNMDNSNKYRVKDGGVYWNQVWERRSYK